MLVVQAQIYFDDAEAGHAEWLEAASRVVAQQTNNPGEGSAAERQSYLAIFDVDEGTGALTPVKGWHLDALGIVRDGLPVADADPGEPAAAPAWVAPTGAHDAYPVGARVSHNGQTWESTTGANVWEPGVFGWVVVQ